MKYWFPKRLYVGTLIEILVIATSPLAQTNKRMKAYLQVDIIYSIDSNR